jgi:hypothetical protein
VVSWFTGENSLSVFADELVAFGPKFKKYANSVAGVDPTVVTASASAALALAEMASKLPNKGGLVSWWEGDNTLSDFADELIAFGPKFKKYADSIAGINTTSLVKSTESLTNVMNALSTANNLGFDGVSAFGEALGKIAKDGVTKFIDAFKNAEKDVSNAGSDMLEKLISGAESKSNKVTDSFEQVATDASSAIKDKQQSFYNAGSYLVTGFADGISENSYKAAAKARAMARAAAEAAEDELDINSPSKVFRSIATSIPEGFAMGIDKFGNVITSSKEMANVAVDTVKDSIIRITDIISDDIDTQPTIRPVLDLSDVRAGANKIGGMFGSVDVLTNVGSINSMMSQNQNGVDSELTHEFDKLNKTLQNMEHATYNINGLNFTESGDVEEAFRTILRAAGIERRM